MSAHVIALHVCFLRGALLRVEQDVRNEIWAEIHSSFSEAELDLVAQLELVCVEEASVFTLIDDPVTVVSGRKARVIDC